MTDSKTSFGAITDVVGIQMYSFLSPKDLQSLSHTTRHFATEVREKLVQICMELLPLKSVDPIDGKQWVSVSKGHSFDSCDDFFDSIVGGIHGDGLRLHGTGTMEESSIGLREEFIHRDYDRVPSSTYLYRQGDERSEYCCEASYNRVVSNQTCIIAASNLRQFSSSTVHSIEEWVRCILSLEDTTAGMRGYHHPTKGMVQYVEKSIMISTPNEGEEMEIYWAYHEFI